MNNETIYALTHTDLDGIGCAILLEKVYPNVITFPVDYRDLPTALPHFIEKAEGSMSFITDLSLSEEQAKMCSEHGKIQHIDHHSSSKKLMDDYPWSFTDVNNCATYHLFKILSTYAELSDYTKFVELVDDYDTWGHGTKPSEEAKDLNRLLNMVGIETFVSRFKVSGSIKLSSAELAIVATDKYQEEIYLIDSLKYVKTTIDGRDTPFAMICSERYTSSLGNYLLEEIPEIEYVMIIDFRQGKASLRGRGNVDVGEIAKEYGGGGHKRSAGFILTRETFMDGF